jgi:hypothetical protein
MEATIASMLVELDLAISEAKPWGATFYALCRARTEVREALQHAKNGD